VHIESTGKQRFAQTGSTAGAQIDSTTDRGMFAFCSYQSAPESYQEWGWDLRSCRRLPEYKHGPTRRWRETRNSRADMERAPEAAIAYICRIAPRMAILPDQQMRPQLRWRTDAKDAPPRRGLSPVLLTAVGVLIGWTVIIVVGSSPPVTSPLLAGLPFLAVLAIACLSFLAVDRYFRERDLRRSVRAEMQRLHALNEWLAKSGVPTKAEKSLP
jgi:hypothetical protein